VHHFFFAIAGGDEFVDPKIAREIGHSIRKNAFGVMRSRTGRRPDGRGFVCFRRTTGRPCMMAGIGAVPAYGAKITSASLWRNTQAAETTSS